MASSLLLCCVGGVLLVQLFRPVERICAPDVLTDALFRVQFWIMVATVQVVGITHLRHSVASAARCC